MVGPWARGRGHGHRRGGSEEWATSRRVKGSRGREGKRTERQSRRREVESLQRLWIQVQYEVPRFRTIPQLKHLFFQLQGFHVGFPCFLSAIFDLHLVIKILNLIDNSNAAVVGQGRQWLPAFSPIPELTRYYFETKNGIEGIIRQQLGYSHINQ